MIRIHTENDINSILQIWLDASQLAHPFLEKSFVDKVYHDMEHMYIPNSETYVYEENNSVLGFISMINNEIGGLFVAPQHHSKGIGSKLVRHILENRQYLEVDVFENNTIGRAFYKKYGFNYMSSYFFEAAKQTVFKLKFEK